MRCRACGFAISEQQLYCQNCGARTAAPREDPLASPSVSCPPAGFLGRNPDASGELVLWKGTYSWKGMIRQFLLAAVGSVALLVSYARVNDPDLQRLIPPILCAIWLVLGGWLLFRKLDIGYTLTNQRLLHEAGILYRRTRRIEAIDIDDLSFEQGIIERMVNVGRIRVIASDASDRSLVLEGIDRPRELYELIEKARRDERMKYGLHVEAI